MRFLKQQRLVCQSIITYWRNYHNMLCIFLMLKKKRINKKWN